MSEIKTKIRTYNDVIDLFGEEKAADMLSEALDWSTIDPKNDKKNIMERKPLLLDPYMTYEGEDYCKHIVAGFLGDRDLDWASGYIDEEKIKNGQVMPSDLKSALSMALDNELSTSWAYLDALSSQCAEICNKFAGYIESAGLARGVLVPGEYELDHDALNADVSERFNIQYGFQCDQMIDAMQFDMTLILTEKVDSMDGYRLIQSVCDWREENLEVIEDAENNLDYGKVPSYVAYERPADIGFLKAAGATINPDAAIIDTMQEFMDAFGNSNTGHRYQPLSMAAERLGYNWTSAPHGSLSDTLACLAAQKCVDDHNWCVENLELTEDAIMHAKPIENGSEGLPKDCWDLNPGGRPFAVTEPILHRLQSSAKLCARAGTTTQFTRMTVNQWFDKAERSQRSPLGRSVDIGRAASALNSQHEHAEVPQDLTK